jgi:carboxyl-terminal processing protease
VLSGIVEQYAMKFVREHESIPPVDQFHFTDYDDFVAFASDKEFDYRSTARAQFDEMRKTLVEDGLEEALKDRLDAMEKALDMDKESFLRLKKDEVLPFIEEEIVVRYYFQKAGIRVRLRYDDALRQSLRQPSI